MIDLSLGPFLSSTDEAAGGYWDYGIRAEIKTNSKYAIMSAQSLARRATVTAEYHRTLALPLPLTAAPGRVGYEADAGGSVILKLEM